MCIQETLLLVSFLLGGFMQPISGDQFVRVSGTGAGTTAIKVSSTVLTRIIIGADKEGTVSFYDHPSGATNLIAVINNNAGSIPINVDFGIQCRNGLTAIVGGTTDLTVVYQ